MPVLTTALVAAALPTSAQTSADTLRVTYPDSVPDVTPYYNQQRPRYRDRPSRVGDSLVYRDPETFQLKPLLTRSYKWADERTLEFTLRQDVTFHNGDRLTADDVVYTINSILTDKQVSTPSNYAFFDHATKLDDMHVRVQLKERVPRRTRIYGDDPIHHAEDVSGEVGAAGILAAPDRLGSIQDHKAKHHHRGRYGAL